MWKFMNRRFDLEREEQSEIIKRIEELDRELLKLEAKMDAKDD